MFNMEMITWEDHYSNQGWQDVPMESPEYLATSIGWVVFEDKKKVVLAQSIAENAVADLMHIMKVNIKARDYVELREKTKGSKRNTKADTRTTGVSKEKSKKHKE